MNRKVTKLEWTGDHDALAAGFLVTMECGHQQFRPTNVLACRAIGDSLKKNGMNCKHCKTPVFCNDDTFGIFHAQ